MAEWTVWTWNVNGLRSVLRKGFQETLASGGPDLLALQETRLRPGLVPPEVEALDGYGHHWSHAERPGYSGVALFSRYRPLSVRVGLGIPEFDREGRCLVAEFESFRLWVLYFPKGDPATPREAYKMAFHEAAREALAEARREDKPSLVCGDFNVAHREIDLARPRENVGNSGFLPEERAWVDRFQEAGYVDVFRRFEPGGGHYTWWTYRSGARERNVGWRIDYVFADERLLPRIRQAFLRPDVTGSDHCPAGVVITV